ncbi:MAG: zinc ABC transporter substrate-binding protein [Candidatus Omnitrophota bacterium]|nr:zinc ABC transporter substrate-binding protein [Candidatus Omnitrophota bacterium]
MKRMNVPRLYLHVLAGLFLLAANASAEGSRPVKAVATIGQITDALKIIGGERVDVAGLMGAGVDPHLYKASESDVRKLSGADIIFYNALHLEAKMEDLFKKMSGRVKTVPVGENVPPESRLESEKFAGHYDPHIWFDVILWKKAVERIRDELAAFDPSSREEYFQRTADYLNELDELDRTVRARAGELSPDQRVLVTAHDAFRYFGRAYGFEVIGLQGISTQAEAGAADIKTVADFIVKRKIKAIFVESSVPVKNVQAVQEAVKARGWDVKIGGELFSDALGTDGTFEGTYIGMVTHNINTIVDALK